MSFKLRADVSVVDTDYGISLLDERDGRYWTLNPTGAAVLRRLLSGGTAAEAADELVEHYTVDLDTAGRDVNDLVHALGVAGLVDRRCTQ